MALTGERRAAFVFTAEGAFGSVPVQAPTYGTPVIACGSGGVHVCRRLELQLGYSDTENTRLHLPVVIHTEGSMGNVIWISLLLAAYLVLRYRSRWVIGLIAAVAAKAIGGAALAGQPDTLTLEPVEGPVTHPQVGVWTDIFCRYADGRRVTFCNASRGGGLDQQPGHTLVRKPGLTTAALYLAFQRERPAGAPVPVAGADVAGIFADAYVEEMAWRKNRGVSARELRDVAREMRESSRDPEETAA